MGFTHFYCGTRKARFSLKLKPDLSHSTGNVHVAVSSTVKFQFSHSYRRRKLFRRFYIFQRSLSRAYADMQLFCPQEKREDGGGGVVSLAVTRGIGIDTEYSVENGILAIKSKDFCPQILYIRRSCSDVQFHHIPFHITGNINGYFSV